MPTATPQEIADIVIEAAAKDLHLVANDDGTYALPFGGGEYLIEIKVHDVTGA